MLGWLLLVYVVQNCMNGRTVALSVLYYQQSDTYLFCATYRGYEKSLDAQLTEGTKNR